MIKFKTACFLMFVFTLWGVGYTAQTLQHTKSKHKIPFYLTESNNLVIKVVLNETDTVNLMLHTAADDMTLTKNALTRLKTIKFNGQVDGVQSWGGSNNISNYSENNKVKMEDLTWENVVIWDDKNSGPKTDGKFGLQLFKDKVVEFDFDKNVLIIENELPQKAKRYTRLKLDLQSSQMYITAVCKLDKDTLPNTFLIHTGYSGAVVLDDDFVSKNKLGEKLEITGEKKLQDSFGNVIATKNATLPSFSVSEYQITQVPIRFFEGALGKQKISILGGDIFKRFNWIIDTKNQFVYLKPNHLFSSKYSTT